MVEDWTANIDLLLGNDNVQGEYYITDRVFMSARLLLLSTDDYKEAGSIPA